MELLESGLAENPKEYGKLLGDNYASSSHIIAAEKAYFYYCIGFSQDGDNVGFQDDNGTPPHYGGPVGDFRNESMPDVVVTALGFDKIHEIDVKAKRWLDDHGLSYTEFQED